MTQADDTTPFWVDPVMRVGYTARGIVYVLVGVFAFGAAWYEAGEAGGTTDALESLLGGTLGMSLLVAIAIGLVAYGVWRCIDGWMDLEDHGLETKGLVARGAMFVSGFINLGLAAYAVSLIWTAGFSGGGGGGQGGGSGGSKGLTAWVLSFPFGAWIVMAAGAVVVCAGLYYGVKAYTGRYKEHLRSTEMSERLDPFAKVGLVAQGLVITITGAFVIFAGWTHNPDEAGGIEQALKALHQAAFGRYLLGAVGIGLMLFCIYCLIEAIYRVIPRLEGKDLITLADRFREKAQRQVKDVAF
ncbi:DUF1206 domain-containing protein [Mangrovicella endophytica]|uniref:DUF1206 domain-containing protein n=1 Tax=Mangrovicella endophytica TaxID=2066697 RepID=UPI0018E49226|nr:DUF1206 domain-containing protein [Mangrovicella endophytica]